MADVFEAVTAGAANAPPQAPEEASELDRQSPSGRAQ
jgi:hypothetical protein